MDTMTPEQRAQHRQLVGKRAELSRQISRTNDDDLLARLSAELYLVRLEMAALKPRRPRGRPRIIPVGAKRSWAIGTPAQQEQARALRAEKIALIKKLKRIQALFAKLQQEGGASR